MIAAMLQETRQLWLLLEVYLRIAVDTLRFELLPSAAGALNPKRSRLQFFGTAARAIRGFSAFLYMRALPDVGRPSIKQDVRSCREPTIPQFLHCILNYGCLRF